MNLQEIIAAITLAPQLLTLVGQTVIAIEGTLTGFSGSEKLAAAEAQINGFLGAAITDTQELSTLQGVLTPVISSTVAALNAAGKFKHAAPQPAA